MLFLFLLIAYSLSVSNSNLVPQVQFPKIFTVGTFVLLISSFSIISASRAFGEDNAAKYHLMILVSLMLGLSFAGCQVLGWLELKETGIFLKGHSSGSFLYVITGLHTAHVVGGLLLLFHLYFKSLKAKSDPVKALVMVTNPYEKLKLKLISSYWHYLGALWGILFFFFLYTF